MDKRAVIPSAEPKQAESAKVIDLYAPSGSGNSKGSIITHQAEVVSRIVCRRISVLLGSWVSVRQEQRVATFVSEGKRHILRRIIFMFGYRFVEHEDHRTRARTVSIESV